MTNEPLSDRELEDIAQALEDAGDIALKMEFLESQKMPCPECGGSGTMSAGSLGSTQCLGCDGARYVDHPSMYGSQRNPAVLRIEAMRKSFRTYTRALDNWIERGRLGPPPPSDEVPIVSEVLAATARAASQAPRGSLPSGEGRRERGRLSSGQRGAPPARGGRGGRRDTDWEDWEEGRSFGDREDEEEDY